MGRSTVGSGDVPVADAGSWSTSFLQILPTTPVCQASHQLPATCSALTALRFTPQELMPSAVSHAFPRALLRGHCF